MTERWHAPAAMPSRSAWPAAIPRRTASCSGPAEHAQRAVSRCRTTRTSDPSSPMRLGRPSAPRSAGNTSPRRESKSRQPVSIAGGDSFPRQIIALSTGLVRYVGQCSRNNGARPRSPPRRCQCREMQSGPYERQNMKRGLTYADAVDYVGVKRRTFDAHWRPHLTAQHQGTALVFDRRDLDRLFDQFKRQSNSDPASTDSRNGRRGAAQNVLRSGRPIVKKGASG